MGVVLFILGAATGSFLNVVAVRYKPDRFVLSMRSIGGRSRCPHCGHALTWSELVPLLSFLAQAGRCRSCGKRISIEYPLVEIVTGLLFVFVPSRLFALPSAPSLPSSLISVAWLLVFLVLLVMTLIDVRLSLIPDEADVFLGVLGILLVFLTRHSFGLTEGSFVGPYALMFGWRQNIWLNHASAMLVGAAFFGALVLLSRGRGMGMGDVKLAAALGFVFGWPDIVLLLALAFILGAAVSLGMLFRKTKTLKSFLPFAPFLAVASALVFFAGQPIVEWYLKLFT